MNFMIILILKLEAIHCIGLMELKYQSLNKEAEWTIIGLLSRWTICQKEMIE